MKKIIIVLMMIFSLVACGTEKTIEGKDSLLIEYINDELHEYVLSTTYSGEVILNNEIGISILLLDGFIDIDLNILFKNAGKSVDELKLYYENKDIYSIYDIYNMMIAYAVLDLDNIKLKEELEKYTIYDLDIWSYTTAINCLNFLNVNSSLKLELIGKLKNLDENLWGGYFSVDTAAAIMVSLQGAQSVDYFNYVVSKIKTGGVVNYSDTLSCSSTAQVIMAFMSEGIIYKGNKLIDDLLSFRTEDGFKEFLNDEDSDYSYASPQAFLAATMYYLFDATGNKIVLY